MKILHVNHSDLSGGASIAAMRLHKALLNYGVDSNFLALNKVGNEPKTLGPTTKVKKYFNLARFNIDQLPLHRYSTRSQGLFSPGWYGSSEIIKIINNIKPDITHFHWINNGMIKTSDIKKIKSPIVWSMHDNWPFAGGCHVKWECDRYKYSCGECPRLGSNNKYDLSYYIFKHKAKIYSKIESLTIVGLSKWITDCAKESPLFKDRIIVNIPNLIDTNLFKPIDKVISRRLWNLPNNKKLILFGAMNATTDVNKGFKELCDALNNLENVEFELIILGSREPENKLSLGFKTHFLGHLSDERSLITLFNAADVMVVPSKQENLSNIIMESLSCGTPVVGFDIGGNSDMIDHKVNGYLAIPGNSLDLSKGIEFILDCGPENYRKFCENSIEKINHMFCEDKVVKKYIVEYQNILNTND